MECSWLKKKRATPNYIMGHFHGIFSAAGWSPCQIVSSFFRPQHC